MLFRSFSLLFLIFRKPQSPAITILQYEYRKFSLYHNPFYVKKDTCTSICAYVSSLFYVFYPEAIPACFSSTGLVKKSHLTSGTLPNRLLAFPLVSVCHRICQSACTLLTESSAVDHLAAALTFQTNQRIIGKG